MVDVPTTYSYAGDCPRCGLELGSGVAQAWREHNSSGQQSTKALNERRKGERRKDLSLAGHGLEELDRSGKDRRNSSGQQPDAPKGQTRDAEAIPEVGAPPPAAPAGMSNALRQISTQARLSAHDGETLRAAANALDRTRLEPQLAVVMGMVRRLAEERQARERAENTLRKCQKIPVIPFPDPGAHSWRAFGTAAFVAWSVIQKTIDAALSRECPEELGFDPDAQRRDFEREVYKHDSQPAARKSGQFVRNDVLRFLHGTGTLHGLSFGESMDGKAFWWRKELPAAPEEEEEARRD